MKDIKQIAERYANAQATNYPMAKEYQQNVFSQIKEAFISGSQYGKEWVDIERAFCLGYLQQGKWKSNLK